jgi:hypothetical protein
MAKQLLFDGWETTGLSFVGSETTGLLPEKSVVKSIASR